RFEAVAARDRHRVNQRVACIRKAFAPNSDIRHRKRDVRLGLTAIPHWFDANVESEVTAIQPESSAALERCRFRNFGQTEKIAVEGPTLSCPASRNRDLNMINTGDAQFL